MLQQTTEAAQNEALQSKAAAIETAQETAPRQQSTEEADAPRSQFLHTGQVFPHSSLEAVKQLRVLKDQEYFEDLLDTVQAEARKLRQARRGTRRMAFAFVSVMALMMAAYIARALHAGNWDTSNLFSYIGLFFSFGGAAAASKTHKKAASELTTIDDLRAVGPLAESLTIEDKRIRAQVQAALIRLLPRLRSSDAALLTTDGRACLNRALNGPNETLTLAILKAYEQVGDEAALPFVERLAAQETNGKRTRRAVSARVADAAQECLAYLRVRVEHQQAGKTLLRGASALDAAPDTLLRPAHDTASDPGSLLRPGVVSEQQISSDTPVLTK